MATRNIPFPDKVRDMVLDVIKHVRRQEYTPEQLCQLQKIIECKYFYWWCMDMKKEEYVMDELGLPSSGAYSYGEKP